MKLRVLTGLLALNLIVGCAPTRPIPAGQDHLVVGEHPDNWRQLARDYIRTSYFDPFSVRDSEASPPFRNAKAFHDHGWTVCIRTNAKNRMGAYTGRTVQSIDIKFGKVVDQDLDGGDCRNNPRVDYQPLELPFAKQ